MANKPIDWKNVERVLVVRLRSIGDAVLCTPSLIALRKFLPEAQVDVLLEDWVAPLFDGFDVVDDVLTTKRGDAKNRAKVMFELSKRGYDVAYNLHGGTTATFFTASTLAKHRVGFADYRYKFLYNFLAPPSSEFWKQAKTHSAEQQLALLGWSGVSVFDKPRTLLKVTETARQSIENKLDFEDFALVHPVAAFDTKQWATEKFARIIEFLHDNNLKTVAVATSKERETLSRLKELCRVP
ncbi:MAG: glycosyltransferase family 9 protein, partial [Pyrinomonadaceae bacterium]|nr:glycosyltransferase family 9 protein [Pyrinomonadaceae bacterium]